MFKTFKEIEQFINDRKKHGIKPGLKRIIRLLSLLGNPQDNVPGIHIAGTNGKGSTVNYLKQALQYNDYHVGVFTSPSLDTLRGHIYINDDMISEAAFVETMNVIYPAIAELDEQDEHPTEFEIITALAFYFFSEQTDIVIIETGMGGRDDTTNCFQPILSIITNIDKDHAGFLGETLKEIAVHKAGIITTQTPVILGEVSEEADAVIHDIASRANSDVYKLGREFTYNHVKQSSEHTSFEWSLRNQQSYDVSLKMLGEHQVKNSSLALMSVVILSDLGYSIDLKQAVEGISQARIGGRLEIVQKEPLIVLDGAHNPAGIKAFIHGVNDCFPETERHLLFAAFKDKEIEEMLNLLSDSFTTITLTTFDHERAASVDYLVDHFKEGHIEVSNDWESYVQGLRHQSSECAYFITGSLDFIGQVRKYLK